MHYRCVTVLKKDLLGLTHGSELEMRVLRIVLDGFTDITVYNLGFEWRTTASYKVSAHSATFKVGSLDILSGNKLLGEVLGRCH